MKKVSLTFTEMAELLGQAPPHFPKYVTQILNLANQNAQGTRPKVVGKLADIVPEYGGHSLREWAEWYLERYPMAIEMAAKKIESMVTNLKDAIARIDESMIRVWVEDLVVVKSFVGLSAYP